LAGLISLSVVELDELEQFAQGDDPVPTDQWGAMMGKNPSDTKGRKNPVENVSWNDCQEFIQHLSDKVPKWMNMRTYAVYLPKGV